MKISIIAAMSINRVIGINNTIPWYIPDDLFWFKCNTMNKPIIMGRKTFFSIGYPLPNRKNIVLSRKKNDFNNKRITWVKTEKMAISIVKKFPEIMIIGGEKIFNLFLPKANRLYLTHIELNIQGDSWFPFYNKKEWKTIFKKYSYNRKNQFNYFFEILER